MGKEWYWVGRSSKRATTTTTTTTRTEETQQTPSGCMCAVFHFFDFHPFHFPSTLNHQQQQQTPFKSTSQEVHHTIIPKGVEAPRNSLESEEDGSTTISLLSKEDNFKIPKNIQIKTRSDGNLNEFSSEISSSPGIKTPTLVARLMGLDLLPDSGSPSFSTPKTQGNSNNTIPNIHHLRTKQYIQTKHRNSIDSSEITRISSSRKSDVVEHHRLSLQINKENLSEEFESPRFSFSKKKFDENNNVRSPSHYAKQIVKQVKESVSRKVGQDITNTREEFSSQIRVKKSSKTSLMKKSLDESNSSSSLFSPKFRFIDTKQKPSNTTTLKDQNTHSNVVKVKLPTSSSSAPKVSRVVTKRKDYELEEGKKLVPKCKKNTNEKFNSRFKRPPQTTDVIRNKQEETFIIKSCKSKKTQPLSSNLLNNINNVSNLLLVKTDSAPLATKIPQKQESDTQDSKLRSQLSSCSSQRYKQEGTTSLATQDSLNGGTSSTTTGGASQLHTPEFQYITKILNRTKSTKTNTTTLFFNQWFSPKHPLGPSIFNHLEHQFNDKDRNFITKNQLGHRWNRRLMFDLVDEVLKEIMSSKGSEEWSVEELIERVWKRVDEFPCAKCEVLEDIDLLIENEDMEKAKMEMEGKEEGENLVTEIEGKIFDTLVHETVMDCFRNTKQGPCCF